MAPALDPRDGQDAREPRASAMARRFLAQAEHDLAAADYLLSSPHAFAAARQAFEAAEKALKAAHVDVRAAEPSFHHDLGALVDRLVERVGPAPVDVEAAVSFLVPVFEQVRYPSGKLLDPIPADRSQGDDARAVVQACHVLMVWIHTLFTRPGGRGAGGAQDALRSIAACSLRCAPVPVRVAVAQRCSPR